MGSTSTLFSWLGTEAVSFAALFIQICNKSFFVFNFGQSDTNSCCGCWEERGRRRCSLIPLENVNCCLGVWKTIQNSATGFRGWLAPRRWWVQPLSCSTEGEFHPFHNDGKWHGERCFGPGGLPGQAENLPQHAH